MLDKSLKRSVSLIGLMGAGKSAIGRQLASQLGCRFADSDTEIEAEAGLSIRDMFELGGEAKFRAIEQRVIRRLLEGAPLILSTGGGAFCQPDTKSAISDLSVSLWLSAPPATLLGRMSSLAARPLLQGPDPLATMEALAIARKPFYSKAELHVDTDGCSLPQASDLVLAALKTAGIITAQTTFVAQ